MDKDFLAGITHATALTRAGSLAEATALIQRTLAGGSNGAPPFGETFVRSGPATDVVIEGECSEVIETTENVQTERAAGPASDVGMRRGLEDPIRKWRRGLVDGKPRATAEAVARQPGEWIAGVSFSSTNSVVSALRLVGLTFMSWLDKDGWKVR